MLTTSWKFKVEKFGLCTERIVFLVFIETWCSFQRTGKQQPDAIFICGVHVSRCSRYVEFYVSSCVRCVHTKREWVCVRYEMVDCQALTISHPTSTSGISALFWDCSHPLYLKSEREACAKHAGVGMGFAWEASKKNLPQYALPTQSSLPFALASNSICAFNYGIKIWEKKGGEWSIVSLKMPREGRKWNKNKK